MYNYRNTQNHQSCAVIPQNNFMYQHQMQQQGIYRNNIMQQNCYTNTHQVDKQYPSQPIITQNIPQSSSMRLSNNQCVPPQLQSSQTQKNMLATIDGYLKPHSIDNISQEIRSNRKQSHDTQIRSQQSVPIVEKQVVQQVQQIPSINKQREELQSTQVKNIIQQFRQKKLNQQKENYNPIPITLRVDQIQVQQLTEVNIFQNQKQENSFQGNQKLEWTYESSIGSEYICGAARQLNPIDSTITDQMPQQTLNIPKVQPEHSDDYNPINSPNRKLNTKEPGFTIHPIQVKQDEQFEAYKNSQAILIVDQQQQQTYVDMSLSQTDIFDISTTESKPQQLQTIEEVIVITKEQSKPDIIEQAVRVPSLSKEDCIEWATKNVDAEIEEIRRQNENKFKIGTQQMKQKTENYTDIQYQNYTEQKQYEKLTEKKQFEKQTEVENHKESASLISSIRSKGVSYEDFNKDYKDYNDHIEFINNIPGSESKQISPQQVKQISIQDCKQMSKQMNPYQSTQMNPSYSKQISFQEVDIKNRVEQQLIDHRLQQNFKYDELQHIKEQIVTRILMQLEQQNDDEGRITQQSSQQKQPRIAKTVEVQLPELIMNQNNKSASRVYTTSQYSTNQKQLSFNSRTLCISIFNHTQGEQSPLTIGKQEQSNEQNNTIEDSFINQINARMDQRLIPPPTNLMNHDLFEILMDDNYFQRSNSLVREVQYFSVDPTKASNKVVNIAQRTSKQGHNTQKVTNPRTFINRVEDDMKKRNAKIALQVKQKQVIEQRKLEDIANYLKKKEDRVRQKNQNKEAHQRLFQDAFKRKESQRREQSIRLQNEELLSKIKSDRRIMNNLDKYQVSVQKCDVNQIIGQILVTQSNQNEIYK